MSVSKVDIIDLVPSQDAPHDINLGKASIWIREDEVARQSLKDIQLSSPAANYDLEFMQPSQGPRSKSSDAERPIIRLIFCIYLIHLLSNS